MSIIKMIIMMRELMMRFLKIVCDSFISSLEENALSMFIVLNKNRRRLKTWDFFNIS